MLIEQISVFVENRQGTLAQITGILEKAAIDIRAFSIADTTDFGILRLIVNNPSKAEEILKENNMMVSITEVIAVRIADKPGALNAVLELLFEKDISVEYAYAFITRSKDDAYVILRVEDNERAIEVLQKGGVSLLDPAKVYSI